MAPENSFIDHVRAIEARLFPDDLDPSDSSRMKSPGYSWYYRPSHHCANGLIEESDISLLSQSGKRLLSVGAFPAYLERVLVELGVPAKNILVADIEQSLQHSADPLPSVIFDMHEPWPAVGTFDRIIFPESLCIAVSNRMEGHGKLPRAEHDAMEATLLTSIMREALERLKPDGIIRANGPMSHPKVVQIMSAMLREQGLAHTVNYRRFLMTVSF